MSTNEKIQSAKRPQRQNRTILPVAAAALTCFLGITGFLGAQMAEGKDPLVGDGKQQTAQATPATVRKVIITRKVIIKEEAPVVAAGAATVAPVASGTTSASVQQSAPVQSAPVQSTPAPVQSGSS